jgi:hypothetical protein
MKTASCLGGIGIAILRGRYVSQGLNCLDSHRDRGRNGRACRVPRRSIEPESANSDRPRSGANRAVHVLDAADAMWLPQGSHNYVALGDASLRTAGEWVHCNHRMTPEHVLRAFAPFSVRKCERLQDLPNLPERSMTRCQPCKK